jgi:iron complex outermembrane receptor protein
VIDYSGRDLPFAPHWSASIEPSYTFKVGNGMATATVQYNFTDTKWGNYTQEVSERLQATRMLNANLSWGPDHGHWSIALWGRNLTNKTYVADALDVPPLFTEAVLGPPREFGVDFKFNF